MKIAAYLATLVVRLLGIYGLFRSGAGLFTLLGVGIGGPVNERMAIVLVLEVGVCGAVVLLAGRIVRLFTADAPFGND